MIEEYSKVDSKASIEYRQIMKEAVKDGSITKQEYLDNINKDAQYRSVFIDEFLMERAKDYGFKYTKRKNNSV